MFLSPPFAWIFVVLLLSPCKTFHLSIFLHYLPVQVNKKVAADLSL